MDEARLVREAQQGDLEAYNRLVLAYQSVAYHLAYRLMGEAAHAADATQEAFIAAYGHLREFRGGSFRAFILRTVTNACYDELRRQKRRPQVSIDGLTEGDDDERTGAAQAMLADRSESPEEAVLRHEVRRALEECLQRLTSQQRAVVVMADIQAMDYAEVADILQVALGTVKSRLARARAHLRDCLAAKGELLPLATRLEGEASS